MKIENTTVFGFHMAIARGMRNPKESWAKSDSDENSIGPKDIALAQALIRAGTDHSKFMRQIGIWVDWTLPIYMWSEVDTYRVGVTRNSCSTMHKLGTRMLTEEDFEGGMSQTILLDLNLLGMEYRKTGNFECVIKMKRLLPCSFLMKSTMSLNYQVARNMYFGRRNHRLPEWKVICDWIEKLSYGKALICLE